jgi:hypothetical protein
MRVAEDGRLMEEFEFVAEQECSEAVVEILMMKVKYSTDMKMRVLMTMMTMMMTTTMMMMMLMKKMKMMMMSTRYNHFLMILYKIVLVDMIL